MNIAGKKLEKILIKKNTITSGIMDYLRFVKEEMTFPSYLPSLTFGSKTPYRRQSVYNAFKRLENRGYIKSSMKSGVVTYRLSDLAKKQLAAFDKLQIKNSKPRKWDHRWRFVSFDIPESQKKHRDTLRRNLKRLGLELFQRSVWLSPYPLNDDFYDIINEAGVTDCVKIIDTDRLPEDQKWQEVFKLK